MRQSNKMDWVLNLRSFIDKYPLMLPLPKIHPNSVSAMSVICSIVFIILVQKSYLVVALIVLLVILLLDWMDGLIAKKFGLQSKEGYICDVTADRLSEGIIFLFFFNPWFFLFTLNTLLTLFSFKRKIHLILPLRHIFTIFFIIKYVI